VTTNANLVKPSPAQNVGGISITAVNLGKGVIFDLQIATPYTLDAVAMNG
jgi:hypothetical protein